MFTGVRFEASRSDMLQDYGLVRIRWVGEEFTTGHETSVELTLSQDGRIALRDPFFLVVSGGERVQGPVALRVRPVGEVARGVLAPGDAFRVFLPSDVALRVPRSELCTACRLSYTSRCVVTLQILHSRTLKHQKRWTDF